MRPLQLHRHLCGHFVPLFYVLGFGQCDGDVFKFKNNEKQRHTCGKWEKEHGGKDERVRKLKREPKIERESG